MTPAELEQAHAELFKKSNEALDLIANAEKKARQRIANEAASALKVKNLKGTNDHDLLIRVETKLTRMLEDLQEIKGGNEKRLLAIESDIKKLEANKLAKIEFNTLEDDVRGKMEDRLRSSENKFSGIWITISIYSLAIVGLFGVLLNHISKMP